MASAASDEQHRGVGRRSCRHGARPDAVHQRIGADRQTRSAARSAPRAGRTWSASRPPNDSSITPATSNSNPDPSAHVRFSPSSAPRRARSSAARRRARSDRPGHIAVAVGLDQACEIETWITDRRHRPRPCRRVGQPGNSQQRQAPPNPPQMSSPLSSPADATALDHRIPAGMGRRRGQHRYKDGDIHRERFPPGPGLVYQLR